MSTLLLVEQTAPDTPSANQVVMYPKSDGKMYTKDDAGVESTVSSDPSTQAQQEAGSATNVYVSPGRQQFHQSAAKAWAYFDSGTTISASYNVTSITDGGSGQATVNLTTAFSAVNFAAVAMAMSGATPLLVQSTLNSWNNAGQILLQAFDAGGAATDVSRFNVIAFGDQA